MKSPKRPSARSRKKISKQSPAKRISKGVVTTAFAYRSAPLGTVVAIPFGKGECAIGKIIFRSSLIKHLILVVFARKIFKTLPSSVDSSLFDHNCRIWTGDGLIVSGKWKIICIDAITKNDEQALFWVSGSTLYQGDAVVRKRRAGDIEAYGVKMVSPPRIVSSDLKRRLVVS